MPRSSENKIVATLVLLGLFSAGLCGYGLWRFVAAPKTSGQTAPQEETQRDLYKKKLIRQAGFDPDLFQKEGTSLSVKGIMLHPYRWYSLPENFKGTYFNTDSYGFRTNGADAKTEAPIHAGFFGGSTGFSVLSDDAHTIPALAEKQIPDLAIKNYAIGGYSLSAELPTFIETVRRDPFRFALFYDGVNEISRYVEYIQDLSTARYYETVGYPYYDAIRDAVENLPGYERGKKPLVLSQRSAALPPIDRKSVDELITPANAEEHAEKIVQLYLANVQDIAALARAHNVTPVFFWQPDIYSTKKPLTEDEKFILNEHPGFRLLAEAVHRKAAELAARPEMKDVLYFDLSDALDDLGTDPNFMDFCHIDAAGNALVAKALSAHLQQVLAKTAPY